MSAAQDSATSTSPRLSVPVATLGVVVAIHLWHSTTERCCFSKVFGPLVTACPQRHGRIEAIPSNIEKCCRDRCL